MKKVIAIFACLLLGLWCCYFLIALGVLPHLGLLDGLKPVSSVAELGDALGVINGFLSAITVVLALVAILIQGKELQESTVAQTKQAQALTEQMQNQQATLMLQVLSTRQDYLLSEEKRMQEIMNRIEGQFDKKSLWENTKNKKQRILSELNTIEKKLSALTESLTHKP